MFREGIEIMTRQEAIEWVNAHTDNDVFVRSELEAAYDALKWSGVATESDSDLLGDDDLWLFCRAEVYPFIGEPSVSGGPPIDHVNISSIPSSLRKELECIQIDEAKNTRQNIDRLTAGDLNRCEILLLMYNTLLDSLADAKLDGLDDAVFNFLISLVSYCQRGLVVGIDRLLKVYFNDCFHSLRLSVECTCHAYKGACDPNLIPVWLDSFESDEAYRAAQKVFVKRFSGNEDLLAGLKLVWDDCSTYSHASPFTVGGFADYDGDRVWVRYFDRQSESVFNEVFSTTTDGHLFILSVLFEVFSEFMSTKRRMIFLAGLVKLRSGDSGKSGLEQLRNKVITTMIQ